MSWFSILAQAEDRGGPSIFLILLILIVVIALLYMLLRAVGRGEREANERTDAEYRASKEAAVDTEPVFANEPFADASPAVRDDLEIIEGIGPKIAGALYAAGVTTFNQLAAMNAMELNGLLQGADIRLADPSSWPEQARLAATGQMDALQELQERLKGGRGR